MNQMDEKKLNELSVNFDQIEAIMNDLIKKLIAEQGLPENNKVLGFTVKISREGIAKINQLGEKKEAIPLIKEEKNALVDIIESERDCIIVAEIGKAELSQIKVKPENENTVFIGVESKENPFYKVIELKNAIKIESQKVKYNNGILEIFFEKK